MDALIVAHRGASGEAVENTLDAYAKAMDVGADLVELDVRRTREGALVCFHDPEVLGRPVGTFSAVELAGAARVAVPPFEAVVALAAERGARLDVELKEAGEVARILDTATAGLGEDGFVVTSFLDRAIAEVKHRRPGVQAGLLLGRGKPPRPIRTRLSELEAVRRARACGADFVAPEVRLARAAVLRRAAQAGLGRSWVWTVNDPQVVQELLADPRVGAVITDHPARALALRDG